jgi:hypothetical protein
MMDPAGDPTVLAINEMKSPALHISQTCCQLSTRVPNERSSPCDVWQGGTTGCCTDPLSLP